ncbi:MAG: hypothetical protein Q8P41_21785 [Pseudomonadota bacterium]|nr:hypothetical protein [Pseudomonadota bacterium]
MIRPAVLLPLLLALAGCPPKAPPPELPLGPIDPAALLERAATEAAPGPSAATFDLRVELPEQHVSAQGVVIVAPPDRFRIEVRGPIGPAQVVVVSDGTRLTTWLAGKNQVYVADQADATLSAYTGGEAGLEALASLLLGRLPALGTPDLLRREGVPEFRWTGPGQSHVDATLDPRTAHLVALALADEAGAALLDARVQGREWPEELVAVLPQQRITATLEFDEWKPAAPPDTAFVLAPPPGSEVKPLLFKRPVGDALPEAASPAPPTPEP